MNLRTALRTSVGSLVVAGSLLIGAGVAGAQEDPYTSQPPTSVLSNEVSAPEVAVAAPEVPSAVSDEALPVTGSDAIQLALIGGGLVAAGTGLVVARRRRAHVPA